jgi:hypothetical protein
MTNVDGNYKKGWRLGKRFKVATGKTTKYLAKKKIKHGAQISKYGGPTVRMFRKTGAAALGTGKFALRAGALGFPGLAATGLYYGAKALGKRAGGKKLSYPLHRQFDKRGRKIT